MKYCKKCGSPLRENAKFCAKCGAKVEQDTAKKEYEDAAKQVYEDTAKQEYDDTMKQEYEDTEIRDFDDEEDFDDMPSSDIHKSNKKSKKPLILFGIFSFIIVLIIVVGFIFQDKIRGTYYEYKALDKLNTVEQKIDYASKAVKLLKNEKSKDILEEALLDGSDGDVNAALETLDSVKSVLETDDYKKIAVKLENRKIDLLCKNNQYQDALKEFENIKNLDGDFRENQNYEDIMINAAIKATGCNKVNSKIELLDDRNIVFDKFDDDYDQIIQVKNSNGKLKIILYKYSNGKYTLDYTNVIDNAHLDGKIEGVYDYAKDKKGVYISFETEERDKTGVSVFAPSENNSLVWKGTVFSQDKAEIQDCDNDGLYEIKSLVLSTITFKETTTWYKINENGGRASKVSSSQSVNEDVKENFKNDYILPYSDYIYLTDNDLKDLNKEELALARNEIFARHGYVFNEKQYKDYFEAKSWYFPNPDFKGTDSELNDREIANYKLILEWEKK
ncbi:YARHG domain-containing protein [Clostridium sp. BJN0001]|uniref:YARHG domain-containing protein n=1 Tax=Clostridium sp. BJN0001 TaxID=2930219 RepID=UPI001FD48DFD|nr:YARHG domain-containing protein [Clostridium sp. BJN0001]